MNRRGFLFGVGATAVTVAASSPLFPAPKHRFSMTDLRVGDRFTIAGVVDPATGRLKTFHVVGSA